MQPIWPESGLLIYQRLDLMLRFKVDENLPVEIATLLQQAGHNALTVMDQRLAGESDTNVAQICKAEDRILVTLDTDFTNIRMYPPQAYPGIMVLRLRQQDKLNILTVMSRLLPVLTGELLRNQLWIVNESRIRIRSG